MNGKNHILRHRSERLAKRLNIPAANVIDLRKIQGEKCRTANKPKQLKQFSLARFVGRMSRIFFIKRRAAKPQVPQEKVIVPVSQINNASPHFQDLPHGTPQQISKIQEQIQERIIFKEMKLPYGWFKRLSWFALTAVVIVVPVYIAAFYQQVNEAKGKVLGLSSTAYSYLQEAGDLTSETQFGLAGQRFSKASEQFLMAQQELEANGGVILDVAKLIPGKVKSADSLLAAGTELSQAGQGLADLVSDLAGRQANPLAADQSSLTDLLQVMASELTPVGNNVDAAVTSLENVRIKDLPKEYQGPIEKVKSTLPVMRDSLRDFFSIADLLLKILGKDSPQRYLFIFQNNRELRATGGFIGSIALMDIYQGKIVNLEVPGGGIYDVAGQLKERLIAPKPLWLVNPYWNIQDSNWFPDFPSSAKKLMWFYERTGGASVDGVISLTPTVIEDLLKISGPIDMTELYGVTVDQDNFVQEAQRWAEVTYDRNENKPKKFIGDLLPLLLDKIFQVKTDNLFSVLQVFSDSMSRKDFLLYFTDAQIQQFIQQRGWDGGMASTDKDYLMAVSTNIGGGKTDQVIDQLIEHHADIDADGFITDTVTVTRVHNGNPLDLWEGSANVSYLRFYVPIGSTLIQAEGFSVIPAFRFQLPEKDAQPDEDLQRIEGQSVIDEKSNTRVTAEFGKTVFGNWLSVNPGESGRVAIKYKLPFRLRAGGIMDKSDNYSLLVQKQPGLVNNFFVSTVNLDLRYFPIWSSSGVTIDQDGIKYASDLDVDKYYGVLLKK